MVLAGELLFERPKIDSNEVEKVAIYSFLPWFLRYDLLPFLFAYIIALYVYLALPEPYSFVALCSLPCLAAVHLITFLSAFWSVGCRSFLRYRKRRTVRVNEASSVKVEPFAHCGRFGCACFGVFSHAVCVCLEQL